MSEWQPIETAPKDGTFVLACMSGPWRETYEQWRAPLTVAWRGFHPNAPGKATWRNADGKPVGPTHWMSIPEPPGGQLFCPRCGATHSPWVLICDRCRRVDAFTGAKPQTGNCLSDGSITDWCPVCHSSRRTPPASGCPLGWHDGAYS